jgi:uncharacterized protein (TIGR02118 family)
MDSSHADTLARRRVNHADPFARRRVNHADTLAHRRTVMVLALEVAGMTTLVVAFEKPEGMSTEAFQTHYREEHAPLVTDLPHLEGYEVTFPRDPDRSPFDGLARLEFPDAAAFGEAMDTEAAERMQADAANFVAEDTMIQLVGETEDLLG